VASLRSARPLSQPGTAFHYFDPNYQILARLVEVVSDQPFDAYLHEHIFEPLGMQHTFSVTTSDQAAARAEQLAQGHVVVYGVPVAVSELSGVIGGSGGVVSTAADMARYLAMQGAGGQFGGRQVLAPASLELTHTAVTLSGGSYAMGWFAGHVRGVRTVEHNGILSTFYSEAALLPDSGYGFVLLYDEYALASAALAFPQLKEGMVALLTGQAPPSGGLMAPALGLILAALSAIGAAMALRSLARLPRWMARSRSAPRWRQVASVAGAVAPGLAFVALPQLLAQTSDRYFGYVMLARAMPDIIVWLGVCAALGMLNAGLQLAGFARASRRRVQAV
jgi:CubicO group peptidase (beta-lactamase class C family)